MDNSLKNCTIYLPMAKKFISFKHNFINKNLIVGNVDEIKGLIILDNLINIFNQENNGDLNNAINNSLIKNILEYHEEAYNKNYEEEKNKHKGILLSMFTFNVNKVGPYCDYTR